MTAATPLPHGPAPQAARRTVTVPERGEVTVRLSPADRVALHELNGRLGKRTFQVFDTARETRLRVGAYLGLFALPSFTLRVTPKAGVHPHNVLYMLHRVSGRRWTLPPAPQSLDPTDLPEELAALFVRELQQQTGRGLLRHVETVQESLPTLRGRLRVAAYIGQPNPLRLPVEYHDHTAAHPVGRLFALVLERLARRVQGQVLRRQVADLRTALHGAGVRPLSASPTDRRPFVLNRLQRRYDPALQLAWLLLDAWDILPHTGEQHGGAFAYNMDRLYEQFLERVLIEDVLPGSGHVGHAQGGGQRERYLFSSGTQQLQPDLIVTAGNTVRLVIDFKNKKPDGVLGREDVYQMYAYARHAACPRALLLYPGSGAERTFRATQGDPLELTTAHVDLGQDWRGCDPAATPLHQQLRELLRRQGINA